MRKWRAFVLASLVSTGLAAVSGCWQGTNAPLPSAPRFPGVTLKVGALDHGEILTGVKALRGEWKASRGGEIEVVDPPVSIASVKDVDVLLFPGDRLGELVDADLLAKIPNEMVMPPKKVESGEVPGEPDRSSEGPNPEDPFQYMDIAPGYRDQVTRYGLDRLALPCGGSAPVLIYRRDAFEREANIAAAKEKGLKLQLPKTWEELDASARFFQGRDWDGDGSPDHGIALVLGADAEGLGNATFLARAASLGQHPDQFSFLFDSEKMIPRVASDPFVEALRAAIAWKASGPPGMETFDADAARASFRSGKVALLIDRAERFSEWSHGKRIGVAPLPGSERVFDPSARAWVSPPGRNAPSYLPHGGGWLVGVRRGLSATQQEAAIDFVKYLASPECSRNLCAERAFPMLPFRASQMSQGLIDPTSAPDVNTRLWSDAVSRTLLTDRIVPGLRIPGASGYLDDLFRGRQAALAGEDPRKALEGVARGWTERTRAMGPKRQLWHYRRSLNLRATTPEPPERGT